MKRDMDLIRKILFAIEDNEHGYINHLPEIPGYSEEQVGYHCFLLHNARLIEGMNAANMGTSSPCYAPKYLTSAGHDFINMARQDTLWKRAKDKVMEKGSEMTIELAMHAMKALLMSSN